MKAWARRFAPMPTRRRYDAFQRTMILNSKISTFPQLSEKGSNHGGVVTIAWPHGQQTATKFSFDSDGWLSSAESLEFALPDELKKLKLARQGCQPVTAD
jgi:hypothetical protein